jgi:ubiquinone/menaquinone biosynthesis C-methylase UbiE
METETFKTNAWQSKEMAEAYHQSTSEADTYFKFIRQELYIEYVQKVAPDGAKILDLGCGSGLISIALHDLGYEVVACDVSQQMLDKLTEVRGARAFELRRGSGFEIPAIDNEFDVVISRMFIQHFPDWRRILVEKARVAKAGGFVIFDFGNREHLEVCDPNLGVGDEFPYRTDPADVSSFYAVASVGEMTSGAAAAGLSVEQISPFGLMLCNGLLWRSVGANGMERLNERLDRLLKSPEARELLSIVEAQVLPLLSKSVTYGNMTVLQKKAPAARGAAPSSRADAAPVRVWSRLKSFLGKS